MKMERTKFIYNNEKFWEIHLTNHSCIVFKFFFFLISNQWGREQTYVKDLRDQRFYERDEDVIPLENIL